MRPKVLIVPVRMMGVHWLTCKLCVSFVGLCLTRNVRVLPREHQRITLPISGLPMACIPIVSYGFGGIKGIGTLYSPEQIRSSH